MKNKKMTKAKKSAKRKNYLRGMKVKIDKTATNSAPAKKPPKPKPIKIGKSKFTIEYIIGECGAHGTEMRTGLAFYETKDKLFLACAIKSCAVYYQVTVFICIEKKCIIYRESTPLINCGLKNLELGEETKKEMAKYMTQARL